MAHGAVYLLTNTVTGKRYVGQTVMGVDKRWAAHVSSRNVLESPIARAIRKHGAAAFSVTTLGECDSRESLDASERFAIEWLGCMSPAGYNLTTGGESGSRHSAETRAKKSAALRARFQSVEARVRQGASARAFWARPEVKAKASASHAAYWTAERREAWSRARGVEGARFLVAARPLSCAKRSIHVAAIAPDGSRSEFPSCAEACRALGLNVSAVSQCLNGRARHKRHRGYTFKRIAKE